MTDYRFDFEQWRYVEKPMTDTEREFSDAELALDDAEERYRIALRKLVASNRGTRTMNKTKWSVWLLLGLFLFMAIYFLFGQNARSETDLDRLERDGMRTIRVIWVYERIFDSGQECEQFASSAGGTGKCVLRRINGNDTR